jgi:hypothetical protein
MRTRKSKGNEEKLYNLVVNEEQLRLIAMCVEDCSRFAAGQFGLSNTVAYGNAGSDYEFSMDVIHDIERECCKRGLIPALRDGSYLKYNSTPFIGNTYQIYREIYHYLAIKYNWDNVYSGGTLPSGTLGTIKVEERNE